MRLVAVPADADAGVVFGAEHLRTLPTARPAQASTCRATGRTQSGIGSASASRCADGVIAIAERRHPAVALEGAELEALQRQCCDAADKSCSTAASTKSSVKRRPCRTGLRIGEQTKLRHSSHFRDGTYWRLSDLHRSGKNVRGCHGREAYRRSGRDHAGDRSS